MGRVWIAVGILIVVSFLVAKIASSKAADFADVVRAHFRAVAVCWKPEKAPPNRRAVEEEISAMQEAAKRFWPQCPREAERHIFTLILSESSGRTGIAKRDPIAISYGVMCVRYAEARLVGKIYGLPYMKRDEKWFRSTLRVHVRASVLYGAAWLAVCYDKVGGDWQRAILLYKYGEAGLKKAVRNLDGRPLGHLQAWKRYERLDAWLTCVENRVVKQKGSCQTCMSILAPPKQRE